MRVAYPCAPRQATRYLRLVVKAEHDALSREANVTVLAPIVTTTENDVSDGANHDEL